VPTRSEIQLKEAFEAFTQGEAAPLLQLVKGDVQVTSLLPGLGELEPRECDGQGALEHALTACLTGGLPSKVQDVARRGDRAMVVLHTPGLGAAPASDANPLRFYILTMQDDEISSIRACRSREEAIVLAKFV